MEGLVHGRPGQVVHGRIDDAKVFLLAGFQVQHFGQAHARIAHQRAARLDHQLALTKPARIEFAQQRKPQVVCRWRRLALIVDAQAAAKINVRNGNARRLDLRHQIEHTVHGVQIRRFLRDLRANVAVNAHHAQTRQSGCALECLQGMFMRYAKLIALESG